MDVVSLFDGMGCLYMALKEAGIPFEKYYASEIEKKPIEFTKMNFPDMNHIGDVTKWRDWGIDWSKVGLIGAGSPCQGFSFAGKMLNFDDPRSALFFVFVDILEHARKYNPDVKFLLENVNMKKEHQEVINDKMGIMPVRINSDRVSAQRRDRLYWSNIKTRDYGLFGDVITDIPQPEDRGILLKDIIESGVVDIDKSYCIDANYWKGTTIEQYIKKARRQIVFEAAAFTEERTDEAKRIRKEYKNKYGRDFSPRRAKKMVLRTDGKMNCLTATFSMKEHTIIDEKINYRKLTPTECFRLQTIPEWVSMEGFSDTALYKMAGNGWTVAVITHILKSMK